MTAARSPRRTRKVLGTVVVVLAALSSTGTATPAHAAESTVTIRYARTHEVGVGLGSGGLYAAMHGVSPVPIPAWASSATVRIHDDRGLPVAGAADIYAPDAPAWAGRPRAVSHDICSRSAQSFVVPANGSLQLRVIAGALIRPDGIAGHGCTVTPSSPSRGVITVTFRATSTSVS
jgi:hypothetical protein